MISGINSIKTFTQKTLKRNIELGKMALQDFKEMHPSIESSTYLALFETKLKRLSSLTPHVDGISKRCDSAQLKVSDMRQEYTMYKNDVYALRNNELRANLGYDNPNSYEVLSDLINEYGVANCGEMAKLVRYYLRQSKIRAENITLYVRDKAQDIFKYDHVFTIFGHNKDAVFRNPETWGEKAVVVDSWYGNGIVLPAQRAIKRYMNLFEVEKNDSVDFFKN